MISKDQHTFSFILLSQATGIIQHLPTGTTFPHESILTYFKPTSHIIENKIENIRQSIGQVEINSSRSCYICFLFFSNDQTRSIVCLK